MWSYFSAIERVYNRLRSQNPVYLDTVNGCNERMWRNWSWEVLTDESQCNIFRARGFYRVYRGTDQRSSRSCVRQVDRKSGSLVMIKDAILYGWRSKLVFIEGKVAANSFNNTIFNTQVTTYMLRYLHTWKKQALVSRMFVYATLLIPILRSYPGQLFYGQYPDRALLGPCRPSHMIRTTCLKKLDWFLSKSGILTIGNHQPIGYIGATTYSRNSGCRWSTHSILTMWNVSVWF